MSKPQWIIFDVGGVLFDYRRAFNAIAKYLEVKESYVQEIINSLVGNEERGGITLERVYTQILSPIGKMSELNKVIDMWYDRQFWLIDTLKLMAQLKSRGYKIAVMTNNWANMGKRLRAIEGMEVVEKFYESSVVGMRKPDLEFYEYITHDLLTDPSSLLLIDDVDTNCEGAKLAGWQSFIYTIGKDDGQTSNAGLTALLL